MLEDIGAGTGYASPKYSFKISFFLILGKPPTELVSWGCCDMIIPDCCDDVIRPDPAAAAEAPRVAVLLVVTEVDVEDEVEVLVEVEFELVDRLNLNLKC